MALEETTDDDAGVLGTELCVRGQRAAVAAIVGSERVLAANGGVLEDAQDVVPVLGDAQLWTPFAGRIDRAAGEQQGLRAHGEPTKKAIDQRLSRERAFHLPERCELLAADEVGA